MSTKQSSWNNPLWMVIIITIVLMVATSFFFQFHVHQIDQQLENLQSNETH